MKEAGSERVRGQESVGLECLQRCAIHGCENLTWGGGVCNRCAEEINGLRETYARIDARRKGTAYAEAARPRAGRLGEFAAACACVAMLVAFLFITRSFWIEWLRMWELVR